MLQNEKGDGMIKTKSLWSIIVYAVEVILMLAGIVVSLQFQELFDQFSNLNNDLLELSGFSRVLPWLVLIYLIICNMFDSHVYYNRSKSSLFVNAFFIQLFFSLVMLIVEWGNFHQLHVTGWFYLAYIILSTSISGAFYIMVSSLYKLVIGQKRLLILGKEKEVLAAIANFQSSASSFHELSYVAFSDYLEKIKKVIDQIDVVYLVGSIDQSEVLEIYDYLMREKKDMYLTANLESMLVRDSDLFNISDENMLRLAPYSLSKGQDIVKRLFDIVLALFMLVLSLPLTLLAACMIKLESEGPIFYKQDRVTRDNKVFSILKFRSMTVDAEKHSGPVLAQANDQRVTKVGKFIRATRIDELPQLINVLKGEMSIVGPRPERPFFVDQFSQEDSHYPWRHHVRAGLTGYAQVYGKYTSDFRDKLKFDLLYIKNYSLLLDIKLLLKTAIIIFDKMSSQGKEEQASDQLSLTELERIVKIL